CHRTRWPSGSASRWRAPCREAWLSSPGSHRGRRSGRRRYPGIGFHGLRVLPNAFITARRVNATNATGRASRWLG
ncbi:MAG: hypothetical protein AVDCRST_MAG66-4367, partial [uncultured Pseudonocardia sp.]